MKIQDVRPLSTSPIGAFCTCAPRAAVTFRPHVTSPIGLPFHLTSPSNGLNARIFLTVPNSIGRQVVGIGPDRWFPRRCPGSIPSRRRPASLQDFPLPPSIRTGRRFRSRGIRFLFSVRRVRFSPPPPFVINHRGRVLSTGVCWSRSRCFFSIHFPPSVKSVFFFFVLPKIIYPFFFTRVDLMCNVIVERLHTAVKRRKHNAFKI